jgi:hypothetical protein
MLVTEGIRRQRFELAISPEERVSPSKDRQFSAFILEGYSTESAFKYCLPTNAVEVLLRFAPLPGRDRCDRRPPR